MKKGNESLESKLAQFLHKAEGNVLDVFYDVYEQFLKDSESPQSLLPIIFEFTERIGASEEQSVKVSEYVQTEIEQRLSEVKDVATRIAKENQTLDIFYASLWNDIFASKSFAKSSEEFAVLLRMLNEEVIVLPYYQAINLCHMDESQFQESLERVRLRIVESTHMLNRHFEHKTETISQLCRVAEGLSQDDTYVYWAAMISLIEKSSYRAGYARAVSDIKKKLDTDTEAE